MLLLVREWMHCIAFGAGIWNFSWGNEVDTDVLTLLKKHSLCNLNWCCFEHTVACTNVTMLRLYVFEKLLRNQSWVNLFSVLLDLILNSLFLILDSCRNQESRIESRIETCNGLSTYFWTVLYTAVQSWYLL